MPKFLLIDKPKGLTSHDVVSLVRKVTGEKRVGHAGTLDPNATGLLVIGVGRDATKLLGNIGKTKSYLAEITLGATSTTYDSEGEITPYQNAKTPTLPEIKEALKSFTGTIKQIPPAYSAIKIQGKKAYELARAGQTVNLKEREITVSNLEIIDYNYPILKLNLDVTSGTYIRSIASDLGETLKTGGYLSNLRRTKIDDFRLEDAQTTEDLVSVAALRFFDPFANQ